VCWRPCSGQSTRLTKGECADGHETRSTHYDGPGGTRITRSSARTHLIAAVMAASGPLPAVVRAELRAEAESLKAKNDPKQSWACGPLQAAFACARRLARIRRSGRRRRTSILHCVSSGPTRWGPSRHRSRAPSPTPTQHAETPGR
jgi:hypothetical protein